MMEAVRTSETSVDNYFTQQYIPEDNSEHHTRRHENLKSHIVIKLSNLNTNENTSKMLVKFSNIKFSWNPVIHFDFRRTSTQAEH
jgi:hypothetical protein